MKWKNDLFVQVYAVDSPSMPGIIQRAEYESKVSKELQDYSLGVLRFEGLKIAIDFFGNNFSAANFANEREFPRFFREIGVNSRQENIHVLISDKV